MTMHNPRLQARLAGGLYLLNVALSVFSLVAMTSMIVSGDAAQTAAKILASEQVFRFAFVANLIAAVAYVGVIAILYELFKPVNATLSAIAAFIGVAGCAVAGAMMIHSLATLSFLGDANYLAAFETDQLQALARTSLRLGALGNSIGLVFFAFYCLSLGFLVLASRFLPKILGVVLVIAGMAWAVGSIGAFLAPSIALLSYLIPVSGLCELGFALWILVMGVNAEKWREQARAAMARAGAI